MCCSVRRYLSIFGWFLSLPFLRGKRIAKIMAIFIIIVYAAVMLFEISYGHPSLNKIFSSHQSHRYAIDPFIADKNNNNNVVSANDAAVEAATAIATTNLLNEETVTIDAGSTVTPKPSTIELNDIFISVKTTQANHANRLAVIEKTWFQLARKQTWFFTDADDEFYGNKLNKHLINTNCPKGHSRRALCCKMAAELTHFLQQKRKKWFCHFDDDNYVNVPQLELLLNEYNPSVDWYLGKPSVASPLEIRMGQKTEDKVKFWFATGGAGFCISRSLASKMAPTIRNNKLMAISDRIRFPDDVTIGFIIEYLLKIPLTVIDGFHSHLEPLDQLQLHTMQNQVSFSYALNKNAWNVIKIEGFNSKFDPTRFYSLHCHLFPHLNFCLTTVR